MGRFQALGHIDQRESIDLANLKGLKAVPLGPQVVVETTTFGRVSDGHRVGLKGSYVRSGRAPAGRALRFVFGGCLRLS